MNKNQSTNYNVDINLSFNKIRAGSLLHSYEIMLSQTKVADKTKLGKIHKQKSSVELCQNVCVFESICVRG